LGGNLGRLCHIADRERISLYRNLLDRPAPPALDDPSERDRRLLTMLHFDLWGAGRSDVGLVASIRQLWANPSIRAEVVELLDVLDARADHIEQPLGGDDAIPLHVHARYSRDEILAAMGEATLERPPQMREGVRYVARHRSDILLVTLRKSEREFSPSTMYRDYAISPRLFHWESQSTTTAASPTGLRYVGHDADGGQVLLFVRESKRSPEGTPPYLFAGPVRYRSHQGERPMAITWELETELPPDFFEAARAVA